MALDGDDALTVATTEPDENLAAAACGRWQPPYPPTAAYVDLCS